MIAGWAREPLVHFLLAGAALFALLATADGEVDPESRRIEVTEEVKASLALNFANTMQRPPTDAELDGLVERWVRDEVLYREALRLGLDRDDAVVRRRLAVKMDALAGAQAEVEEPSDAVLRAWLRENPQRFVDEPAYSFDQLWFESEGAAQDALRRLEAGAQWQALGGAISLPASVEDEPAGQVASRYGRTFAAALEEMDAGDEWRGPVPSGFGWHLVRLRSVDVGALPPFEEIRARVEADWRSDTIAARRAEAYATLREAYRVDTE
ncbi:peptidyl-prolyl cis-trans isomerase [Qipengyuania sp. MTN3-11]|uniref:peptidylprolyl isomerase n=1 Tax=Qipengyuania sp. MTN3-11 TaxID=3056557 RepID=UPI0036F39EE4